MATVPGRRVARAWADGADTPSAHQRAGRVADSHSFLSLPPPLLDDYGLSR
jgi:hypothetical protein